MFLAMVLAAGLDHDLGGSDTVIMARKGVRFDIDERELFLIVD